ncbi:MAG: Hemolysin-type calcium-binding region [Verrucomicrobiales bacterium]|nr:Hemolysin-type calcium-binding region [Verrucomicrobiales bacterium]
MAYNHDGNGGVAGAGQVYVFDGTEYTIISSNGVAGSRGIGMDASGSFTTLGFNFILFGDGSYGITNGLNSDTIGSTENPVLAYRLAIGRLAMNGGPTATHALFGSSMLIDKGNSFGVRTDQRGQPRTVNVVVAGRPNGGDGTDIGAYEFNGLIPPFPQPPPPPASPE